MVLLISSIVFLIVFIVLYYLIAKSIKKRKDKKNMNYFVTNKKIKSLEEKIKTQIPDIEFGAFGKFTKDNIKVDNIFWELSRENIDDEEQIKIAYKIIYKWKSIIELHNQYLINCFMKYPLIKIELDEYWDNWCFSEDEKKLSEDQLDILRKEKEQQIEQEIKKYEDKKSQKNIAELYKKYFPYLNYNNFIKSIKLDELSLSKESFNISITDKNWDLFCGACAEFDIDLNDYDWHNF